MIKRLLFCKISMPRARWMQIRCFSCTFHKCQRSMFFRGNVTPKINKRWNSLGMAVGGVVNFKLLASIAVLLHENDDCFLLCMYFHYRVRFKDFFLIKKIIFLPIIISFSVVQLDFAKMSQESCKFFEHRKNNS